MEEHTPAEHRTAEGSDHSEAATPSAAAILKVATIADVVRVMIEDRERHEQEIAEERVEERRRFEEESERRIRDMTKQLELLCEMVTTHNARRTNRVGQGEGVRQINSPLGLRRH